jgi:cell division protein FtsL
MTTRFRQESQVDGFTAPLPVDELRRARRPGRAAGPTRQAGRRLNNAATFLVVALAIATVGLLYLVQTSKVAGLGYTVTRLEQERVERSLENQQLSYQIAQLQALPRVEEMAREQLEMGPVEDDIYLSVPRPAADELAVPQAPRRVRRSVFERIWDRLTGEAEATHPDDATARP